MNIAHLQMNLQLYIASGVLFLLCPYSLAEDTVTEKAETPLQRVDLLNKQFPGSHWESFSGKKDSPLKDTWKIVTDADTNEVILVCSGQPYGYLRTRENYSNYRFGVEWRFPQDINGNSGILIHTTGEDRIWPKSLQIQLHQPVAGSTFPSHGAKTENELRNVPMLSKPVNHWNTCTIHSLDGVVRVTVNDTLVGEVTGCVPSSGKIALQSEGAEVHFRNIWIEEIPEPSKQHPVQMMPVIEEEKTTTYLPVSAISSATIINLRECTLQRHTKKKKPLVIKTQSQRARGERRLRAEWVQLQTIVCD